jgi:leucyl-tRNA synthetase
VNSWLGRVFAAVQDAFDRDADEPEALRRLAHRTIKGVTEDLESLRFNVAIAKLMVLTNEIRSALDAGAGARGASTALVQMIAPMAPFVAEELWHETLGNESSVHLSSWPAFDPALAAEDSVVLVIQVDGRVRDRIDVPADASEERCRDLALASEKALKAVDGREIRQVIARPPRLVNLVTRG